MNIRGCVAGKSKKLPFPGVKFQMFLNNPLSFSFFGQICALQGNLYEIYRKMWKYYHPSDLNHIRRVQMAENDLSESKMTNMDPVMELILQK